METNDLTCTEVADELEVTEATVRRYIHNGLLDAYKKGPIWLICPTSVDKVADMLDGEDFDDDVIFAEDDLGDAVEDDESYEEDETGESDAGENAPREANDQDEADVFSEEEGEDEPGDPCRCCCDDRR